MDVASPEDARFHEEAITRSTNRRIVVYFRRRDNGAIIANTEIESEDYRE